MIRLGFAVPVAVPLDPTDHDIILALGEDLPVAIWVARAPHGELIYKNRMFVELMGPGARYGVLTGGCTEPHGVYTRDGAPYPESKMPFVRALSERRVITADDLTIQRHDGKRVEVRVIARPVGTPITHVIVTMFDVSREVATERARAELERRLHRAQRLEAIGTLAGGIAHDFNNLIFSVKLLAAELAATEQAPKRQSSLAMIDELTERSATLTRALLGFIRRGKHHAMPISVNDIVISMTELLGRTLPGVALMFELEATDRGHISGDHAQLEQVIMNLVLHACEAAQGAGRIVVRTADLIKAGAPDAARFVVLEVQTDGPELSPGAHDRVPASPVAASPEATSAGAGFGPASVVGILESHGATLQVDTGQDGSTTMRAVFPAMPRQPATKPRISIADFPRGTGLVLIVDDDPMVRKVISGSLGTLGYTTIEAVNGPAAVELYQARHHEIRAVVLDMVMPGMTGRATYLALRAIDSNVAVLLMSGNTLNDQVQEILDLGVRNFVSKPYSISALAKAIAELIQ